MRKYTLVGELLLLSCWAASPNLSEVCPLGGRLALAALAALWLSWALVSLTASLSPATPPLGAWALLTLATAALAAPLPSPASELWAAPLHVVIAAAACVAGLIMAQASAPAPRPLATLGAATALLGLMWNHSQSGGGWAWDWIEAAPVCLCGGLIAVAHGWGRFPWCRALLVFAASLQLGRNALTLSLHHAQAPGQRYTATEEGAAYAALVAKTATTPLWSGAALGLLPRPAPLRRPQAADPLPGAHKNLLTAHLQVGLSLGVAAALTWAALGAESCGGGWAVALLAAGTPRWWPVRATVLDAGPNTRLFVRG